MKSQSRQRQLAQRIKRGFTLIEILVVIVVIAVLATLVAPSIFQHVDEARIATAKSQIQSLEAALASYRLNNGYFPSSEQGLDALVNPPQNPPASDWRGPYMSKGIPLDPWKNAYVYMSPGEVNPMTYDLYSLGADGQVGGEGINADIVSW